jgi:hypothetical protein
MLPFDSPGTNSIRGKFTALLRREFAVQIECVSANRGLERINTNAHV